MTIMNFDHYFLIKMSELLFSDLTKLFQQHYQIAHVVNQHLYGSFMMFPRNTKIFQINKNSEIALNNTIK